MPTLLGQKRQRHGEYRDESSGCDAGGTAVTALLDEKRRGPHHIVAATPDIPAHEHKGTNAIGSV